MQSNQPPAKICFKSYSNHILIDFIDQNSLLDFESLRQNQFQQINFNQKWLNLIDFCNLLIDFFDLLIDFFDLLINLFNRNRSNLDRNRDR